MNPQRPMPPGGVGGMPMGMSPGVRAGMSMGVGMTGNGMHPQTSHMQNHSQGQAPQFRPQQMQQQGAGMGAALAPGMGMGLNAQSGVNHSHGQSHNPQQHYQLHQQQQQQHQQSGMPPQLQHMAGPSRPPHPAAQGHPHLHSHAHAHPNAHALPHPTLNGASSPHPSSGGISTPPNGPHQNHSLIPGVPGTPGMTGTVAGGPVQQPSALPSHFAPPRRPSLQMDPLNADSSGMSQAPSGSGSAQAHADSQSQQLALRPNGYAAGMNAGQLSTNNQTDGTAVYGSANVPPAGFQQSQMLPGSGIMRMLQYSEALSAGPERETMEYWQDWAKEFYAPNGVFHYVLWNPTSREQKAFEVPTSVLPRYMLTSYISGMKGASLHLESPREYVAGITPFPSSSSPFSTTSPAFATKFSLHLEPSAAVTHLVQCDRAVIVQYFASGWQIHQIGAFRAALVPALRLIPSQSGTEGPARYEVRLRLESFDYSCISHTSYLPQGLLSPIKVEQNISKETVQAILAAHGVSDPVTSAETDGKNAAGAKTPKKAMRKQSSAASKKEEKERSKVEATAAATAGVAVKEEDRDNTSTKSDGKEDEGGSAGNSAFSMIVEKLDLPESPVNEYGITLRAMRCLEITESVCHLRALMDFTQQENIGPLEGLRKLAQQFREQQRITSGGGPSGTNFGLLPAANISGPSGHSNAGPVSGAATDGAGSGGQTAEGVGNKRKGAPGDAATGNTGPGRLNLSRASTQQSNASPTQTGSPTKRQR